MFENYWLFVKLFVRMWSVQLQVVEGFLISYCKLVCITHTTILRLFGFCPRQPGWAGTRRNIHPLTPIMVIKYPYLLPPSTTIHGILHIQSMHFTVFFYNLSPVFFGLPLAKMSYVCDSMISLCCLQLFEHIVMQIVFVGMLIGSNLWGSFSDKYGRRPVSESIFDTPLF